MARKVHHANQQHTSGDHNQANASPMIVERVNQIPIVNLAVTAGFSQYDKLKASNVTIGDVMSQAEKWASYFWSSVQPVVDKLHDPIEKADKLACKTLDYVEANVPALKKSPQELLNESKSKYNQVVEQSILMRLFKTFTELLYGTATRVASAASVAASQVQQHHEHLVHSQQQPPQQQHSSEVPH